MKRSIYLLLVMIFVSIFFSGCSKKSGKIPYLPISINDVTKITLYGLNEKEQRSNIRNATEEEKTEIIQKLNNIKNYERETKISKYGNGKPELSNIQIFTYGSGDTDFMYILEKDNGYIMISKPQSGIGYIVKQPELNKLLRQLRQ